MIPNSSKTLADLALRIGWTATSVSLYDEEGVEGWRWTSARGEEYECIADPDVDAPTIEEDLQRNVLRSLDELAVPAIISLDSDHDWMRDFVLDLSIINHDPIYKNAEHACEEILYQLKSKFL